MLKITNLHAHFEETPILKGVDLQVLPGEIHAILGPNGSGKSTLGRVILGDEKYEKTQGDITFNAEDFEDLDPSERAQKGFFLSFQMPPELDGVSAKEFLFAAKKSVDPDFTSSFRFKKQFAEILKTLHLNESFIDREMNKGASGGERRKMEMATMLLLNPSCVFLDEIDSGIDIDARKAIVEGIKKFSAEKTKSIVLVTHTEKFLEEIVPTHVHVMIRGKIVQSGGPELIDHVHQNGYGEWLKATGMKVLG